MEKSTTNRLTLAVLHCTRWHYTFLYAPYHSSIGPSVVDPATHDHCVLAHHLNHTSLSDPPALTTSRSNDLQGLLRKARYIHFHSFCFSLIPSNLNSDLHYRQHGTRPSIESVPQMPQWCIALCWRECEPWAAWLKTTRPHVFAPCSLANCAGDFNPIACALIHTQRSDLSFHM